MPVGSTSFDPEEAAYAAYPFWRLFWIPILPLAPLIVPVLFWRLIWRMTTTPRGAIKAVAWTVSIAFFAGLVFLGGWLCQYRLDIFQKHLASTSCNK